MTLVAKSKSWNFKVGESSSYYLYYPGFVPGKNEGSFVTFLKPVASKLQNKLTSNILAALSVKCGIR